MVCKVRNQKELKCLIQEEIQGVEFSHPKCKNESDIVSLKLVNDVELMKLEEQEDEGEMKTHFSAAKIIRKTILNSEKWNFKGSLTSTSEQIPETLSLFFKWCLVGKGIISRDLKWINEVADRSSQTLMYECLSPREISPKCYTFKTCSRSADASGYCIVCPSINS